MDKHDPVENDDRNWRPQPTPQRQRRRKGVNVLRFLLPGRLRGISGIVLAFLGVAGLSAVIILLVALIAYVVKRSGETVDFLPTATSAPLYREAATATAPPTLLRVTAVFSPTVSPVAETPGPPPTEQLAPTKWMKVTDTGALGLRRRSGPGLNYETTGVFDDGAELRVIGGPQEADGIVWWQLESESGVTGWAAGNYLKPIERAGGD